jgi:hypothetical protein
MLAARNAFGAPTLRTAQQRQTTTPLAVVAINLCQHC